MTKEQIRIRDTPELANLSERLMTGFEDVYRAAGKELQSSRRPDPLAPAGVGRALQEIQKLYTYSIVLRSMWMRPLSEGPPQPFSGWRNLPTPRQDDLHNKLELDCNQVS